VRWSPREVSASRNLIKQMMSAARISQAEAVIACQVITVAIAELCERDGRLAIPKLGIFTLHHVRAREGHNFLINRRMTIRARNEVRFRAAKELKERLRKRRR
jgi:nucleoid DNA-binding protein